MAEQLALKKYYLFQVKELTAESRLLDKCLTAYDKCKINSATLLEQCSNYKPLLDSFFSEFPKEIQQWVSQKYTQNQGHPEHLMHHTLAGHYVRSKSEVIIANTLFLNHIPYRYESELRLQETMLYPDFTILHPQTRKLFYWEHYGMMDNLSYCENAYNKLKIYASHEIIPSINMILTFETQIYPINSEKIQQIVQEYFL